MQRWSAGPPAWSYPVSCLGWIGAMLAGLIGGFIGSLLFKALGLHDPGFALFGVDLVPALVRALIVVVAVELYTTRRAVV